MLSKLATQVAVALAILFILLKPLSQFSGYVTIDSQYT